MTPPTIIARRPVNTDMILRGAKKLWDQHREIEGRVEWDDAAPWVQESWIRKSQMVLEAALPQDRDFLRKHVIECASVADML